MRSIIKTRYLLAAVVAASASCATERSASSPTLALTTICEVNGNMATYIGAQVRMKGVLMHKGRHGSYVVDNVCGTRLNSIDIRRTGGNYQQAKERWLRECDERGEITLCMFEKRIEFVGQVVLEEGVPAIDVSWVRDLGDGES